MAKQTQSGNATIRSKVSLRIKALKELEQPVVMETHGGMGKIWIQCYSHMDTGVVFEKRPEKASSLALQRPGWAVYETDCEVALRHGVGSHLPINFVDFDPYGGPWVAIDSFFEGIKPGVPRLVFTVTDGLPVRLKLNTAWITDGFQDAVDHFGNARIYHEYAEVCKWLMQRKAAKAGYILRRWAWHDNRRPDLGGSGEHPGEGVVHYAAVMDRAA